MASTDEDHALLAMPPEPDGDVDGKGGMEMRAIAPPLSPTHLEAVAGKRDFDSVSRTSTLRSRRSGLVRNLIITHTYHMCKYM